jgi:hypothetical protein
VLSLKGSRFTRLAILGAAISSLAALAPVTSASAANSVSPGTAAVEYAVVNIPQGLVWVWSAAYTQGYTCEQYGQYYVSKGTAVNYYCQWNSPVKQAWNLFLEVEL